MNKKCQVFTPKNYVNQLLDNASYKTNLFGKKVLENSCGDGNILSEIVLRYIRDCKNKGFSNEKIRKGLKRDIYGVEIDKQQYEKCINRLNAILESHGIIEIEWNIINDDYLKDEDNEKYDYIIGNPPYITYSDIKESDRVYLRDNYRFCKNGKFDYCYAFIEKSIAQLADKGILSYLVPSSLFKSVYGYELREGIKQHVDQIIDFSHETIFDNALVKSSIIVLKKNKDLSLIYCDATTKKRNTISKKSLKDKWVFSNTVYDGHYRFGDYFIVSHAVATLLNKAFIIKSESLAENEQYYVNNGYELEKGIIRDTASPRSLKNKSKEKIIFPYQYRDRQLLRYSEQDFIANFPKTYAYLSLFKSELLQRNSDNTALWFEYGRTQALNNICSKKLLISRIVTNRINVYTLKKECIPYGGMYIIPREDNNTFSLELAKKILLDNHFYEYALSIGTPISGSSVRITSKDIEEYKFTEAFYGTT